MFDINTIVLALNAALEAAVAKVIDDKLNTLRADLDARLNALVPQQGDFFSEDQKEYIKSASEAAAERWLDEHTSEYNHDGYDSVGAMLDNYDLDDFLTYDRIESMIEESLDNALEGAIEEQVKDLLVNNMFKINIA